MNSRDLSLQMSSADTHMSRDGFRDMFMKKFYDPARRGERQALVHLEIRVWQDYVSSRDVIVNTEDSSPAPELA